VVATSASQTATVGATTDQRKELSGNWSVSALLLSFFSAFWTTGSKSVDIGLLVRESPVCPFVIRYSRKPGEDFITITRSSLEHHCNHLANDSCKRNKGASLSTVLTSGIARLVAETTQTGDIYTAMNQAAVKAGLGCLSKHVAYTAYRLENDSRKGKPFYFGYGVFCVNYCLKTLCNC
jgi:hypothetical protein